MTYANNSAPRFDLGSFFICFLFLIFVLLVVFGSSTFPEWARLVRRLVDGCPGPPSFGARCGHLT
jgi:hypothetical protein